MEVGRSVRGQHSSQGEEVAVVWGCSEGHEVERTGLLRSV